MGQHRSIAHAAFLLGLFLALASGLASALAGLGSRWEWWYFRTGFGILKWSAYGGIAAAALCGTGLALSLRNRLPGHAVLAVIGLVISVAATAIPWTWMMTAKRVPLIHDISTDTTNPPRFRAILPLRKHAPNPAEYGGPETATLQSSAYPDVKSMSMDLSVSAAFDKALAAARRMGWEIVDANKNEGRIEAMDKTFWFGFVDDIVIRISRDKSGSIIDIRSVSRVGKSDVGTNAGRIRSFLKRLKS